MTTAMDGDWTITIEQLEAVFGAVSEIPDEPAPGCHGGASGSGVPERAMKDQAHVPKVVDEARPDTLRADVPSEPQRNQLAGKVPSTPLHGSPQDAGAEQADGSDTNDASGTEPEAPAHRVDIPRAEDTTTSVRGRARAHRDAPAKAHLPTAPAAGRRAGPGPRAALRGCGALRD